MYGWLTEIMLVEIIVTGQSPGDSARRSEQ